MNQGLIGFTGFVGTTLSKQNTFSHFYNSKNINEISNVEFDTIVCAGTPAQKWIANKDPKGDLEKISTLIKYLKNLRCKKFILISTVDVFKNSSDVNEHSLVEESELHPYGFNRRYLEKFVESYFSDFLIVRLPGLVGPGLKKNIIFDFLNHNCLDAIDCRSTFQFYPMVNLWSDISIAIKLGLKIVHLTAEPISVGEVSRECFGIEFTNKLDKAQAIYNMKTIHASSFGGIGDYQYSQRESITVIRAYAQSEAPSNNNLSL